MHPRRKKKNFTPLIIAILVLVLLAAVLLRFVFIVRSVDVTGDTGTLSAEDVIRAAKVQFGTSIFRVNENAIMQNVNETGVLRVEDVSVDYPSTLTVSVVPRNRMGMALHLGRMRILDEQGILIESLDNVPQDDLIYISGLRVQGCTTGAQIQADSDQLSAYCDVMQALLHHNAAAYVSEINLDVPSDIRLLTRNGVTVEMGNSSNAIDKIAWMKGAVSDLEVRGQGGGTLDVRSGTKADYRAP